MFTDDDEVGEEAEEEEPEGIYYYFQRNISNSVQTVRILILLRARPWNSETVHLSLDRNVATPIIF